MASLGWVRQIILLCLACPTLINSFDLPAQPTEDLALKPHKIKSTFERCPRLNPNVAENTLIDRLWKNNCDLVGEFLNNIFLVSQANSTIEEPSASFKYFSVQDYYYLLLSTKIKALLIGTIGPQAEQDTIRSLSNITAGINKSLKYARDFRNDLTTKLDISEKVIQSKDFEAAGSGYVDWLISTTRLGKFALQVARIPCYYGWAEIAHWLDAQPYTKKNTSFHSNWIQKNMNWSSGAELSGRLEAALEQHNSHEDWETFNRIFRLGMRYEILFFSSAVGRSLDD